MGYLSNISTNPARGLRAHRGFLRNHEYIGNPYGIMDIPAGEGSPFKGTINPEEILNGT